jgi:hypothetical protein
VTRLPGRRPGPAEREELLALWDQMTSEGQKMVIFVARAAAKDEGLLPPGASLFPAQEKKP